jgi:hypothetical protein
MIEKDQIKWIKDDNPEETGVYGQIYYKEVRLDLSVETIQDMQHGSITEEECEKAILNSYKRCLRIHREKILNDLLNEKNRNC